MDINHIKYTWKHKKAFLNIEKKLLGRNTLRGYLHDVDKLFLYLIANNNSNWVSKLHRKYSRHHQIRARTNNDYIQTVIDWKCARYTKPDKPLNARETLYKFYSELSTKVEPILDNLKL